MTLKYLKRKVTIGAGELENLCPMDLEYYLLEKSETCSPDLEARKVYGICVSKKVSDLCSEEKSVTEVSCCAETAVSLIQKLADNAVTPVSLLYVLDDIMCG